MTGFPRLQAREEVKSNSESLDTVNKTDLFFSVQ